MVIAWLMMVNNNLVGGIPTPLKNVSSSVGMIIPFPTELKVIKFMFQTTNQQHSVALGRSNHFQPILGTAGSDTTHHVAW